MFQDPKFLLAVSFFIFLGFMIKLVLPRIITALKNRSDEIYKKFSEIEVLEDNARQALLESQSIRKNMEKEAIKIINEANNEVDKILKKAEEELRKEVKSKIRMAEEKIEQEKERIITATKMSIVSLAMDELKKNFEKNKLESKNLEKDSILHISKAIN